MLSGQVEPGDGQQDKGVGPIGLVAVTTNPFPAGAALRVCLYKPAVMSLDLSATESCPAVAC